MASPPIMCAVVRVFHIPGFGRRDVDGPGGLLHGFVVRPGRHARSKGPLVPPLLLCVVCPTLVPLFHAS